MIVKLLFKKSFYLVSLMLLGFLEVTIAQNAVKDTDPKNDVLMQTFGWDEYQQPRIAAAGGLYNYYLNQADYLSEAGFDMIWLPPPSQSTGGVGYLPTKLYNFSQTSWGSEAELKAMLDKFNALQMYPIADIVVNHRNGTTGYTDFTEPTWGCETICYNDDGGSLHSAQYVGCKPSGANDTGDDFGGGRDLDHTSTVVQEGVKEFLRRLKVLGYKGWRWDVAKGFSSYYFGVYNKASQPYYSVGEYWDGNANTLINWINGTDGTSGVFDFALYYTFSGAFKTKNFSALNAGGRMPGLAGRSGYDDKAVTFLDNHDTFVHDTYTDDYDVEMAYAYILTHPGIPKVFSPHYYGGTWTKDGKSRTYGDHQVAINKLVGVRKQNGINAWSQVQIFQSGSTYEAHISPSYGAPATVAVKLGADLSTPFGDWIENASGNGYKVWSKKTILVPSPPEKAKINISLIGPGITDWSTDVEMTSTDNENYTLSNYVFKGGDVKFRANAAWFLNWGSVDFPNGTGTLNGDNIPTVAGTYTVTFNRSTGEYSFNGDACTCSAEENPVCANFKTYANPCEAACAGVTDYVQGACTGYDSIGIIGTAVGGWATDIDLTTNDGVTYTLVYTLEEGEAKFRKNDDWTINWGAGTFPSGTGIQAGDNIPVTAGKYLITFNATTGAYSFDDVPIGIEEFDFNPNNISVRVFPNPTSSDWNIFSEEAILSISLVDASGKKVANSFSSLISGQGLSAGLYFAKVTTETSVQTIKLLKE